jgi:hypothetical protein
MSASSSCRIVGLLAGFSLISCFAWQGLSSAHHYHENLPAVDTQRRKYLGLVSSNFVGAILGGGRPTSARNLPEATGADLSKVGTVETLVPIIAVRYSLDQLRPQLAKPSSSGLAIDSSIPRDEMAFKRLFDAYSDPVSYKQNFLDQNAFLVYYTKGFDGPGRSNIEADMNQRQTEQFGLRNEAWIAWENFLAETAFLQDEDNDCISYLNATIRAIDSYIMLAPVNDAKTAQSKLGMSL